MVRVISLNSADIFCLALYAFDGIENHDRNVAEGYYTHVLTLYENYRGENRFYKAGVGRDWYSKVYGGLHGLGGASRLREAYERFIDDYKQQVVEKKTIDDIDLIVFIAWRSTC